MVDRLNFNEFITAVANRISTELGSIYEVTITKTTKNNGLCLQGLCIRCSNSTMAPNIYLMDYHIDYVNGRDFEEVVSDILETYRSSNKTMPPIKSFEWDITKDSIVLKLVNYKMNEQMMQEIPHKIAFEDLAVTFHVLVSSTKEGIQTVKLINKLFNGFGVSIDEMYEIALENTKKLFPATIQDMNEILLSMLKAGMEDMEDWQELKELTIPTGEEPRMYVLNNNTGIYGAATLLYPGVLEEFADKVGRDLFILPSSLHEIILVPMVSKDFKVENLRNMVNEVNQNEVMIEDVLSNSVYRYSRKENRIERL
jgi:hypothetical protein